MYSMIQSQQEPTIVKLSELIAPCYYDEYRKIKEDLVTYFLNKGGRSSCKSSFISIALVLGLKKDPIAHAAVFMKVADKIEDKVAMQIQWAINVLHLAHEWKMTKRPCNFINIYTGQKIFIRGLDDPEKVTKGLKLTTGYFKYIWFEEANAFTNYGEIRTALNSLFRKSDVNLETHFKVFFSYNPPREPNNWINKHAKEVKNNPNWYVLATTYLDVPTGWLPKEFYDEAQRVKEVDEKTYRHDYLGEAVGRDGLVYPMFSMEEHVIKQLEGKEAVVRVVCGIDGGAIIDATTCVPLAITTHGRIVCLPTMYYDPTAPGHQPLATQDQAILIENHLEQLWNALGYQPSMVELVIDSAASDIFLQLLQYGHYNTMKVGKKDIMVDMRRVQALLSYQGAFKIIDQGYKDPLTGSILGEHDMLIEELQSKVIDEKTGKPEDGGDHDIDALKYTTYRLQEEGVI